MSYGTFIFSVTEFDCTCSTESFHTNLIMIASMSNFRYMTYSLFPRKSEIVTNCLLLMIVSLSNINIMIMYLYPAFIKFLKFNPYNFERDLVSGIIEFNELFH